MSWIDDSVKALTKVFPKADALRANILFDVIAVVAFVFLLKEIDSSQVDDLLVFGVATSRASIVLASQLITLACMMWCLTISLRYKDICK